MKFRRHKKSWKGRRKIVGEARGKLFRLSNQRWTSWGKRQLNWIFTANSNENLIAVERWSGGFYMNFYNECLLFVLVLPSFAEGKQQFFRNNLEKTKLRKVCARNQIWDSFNSIQKLFTEFVTQHLPLQSWRNSLKTKLSSSWNSQAQIFKWHNLLSGYCLHERRFKNYANSSFYERKTESFKGKIVQSVTKSIFLNLKLILSYEKYKVHTSLGDSTVRQTTF